MLEQLKLTDIENIWGGSKKFELPKGIMHFNGTKEFKGLDGYCIRRADFSTDEEYWQTVKQFGLELARDNYCVISYPPSLWGIEAHNYWYRSEDEEMINSIIGISGESGVEKSLF